MTDGIRDERPRITQEMINLYDRYTHHSLDRREFMDQLAKLAGSMGAAVTATALMAANASAEGLTSEGDVDLDIKTVSWTGATSKISGYLVLPKQVSGPVGGVIVLHENRGLNAHIKDVARRVAHAGFVALAPDFLSSLGGTPADEDQARDMFGQLNTDAVLAEGVSAVNFLAGNPAVNGKIGAIGFCWGGGVVNMLAAAAPRALKAGVAYYGAQPPAAAAAGIKARLMLHYAGLDTRINAGIDAFQAALDAAGTDYQLFVYEGVNHAFNNDTSEARYNRDAAVLAWARTIKLFQDTLSS